MSPDLSSDPMPLEKYRPYLLVLARGQWQEWFQSRVDPEDLVQKTLVEAHDKWSRFKGGEVELAAWLRKILHNNLIDLVRAQKRVRRDPAKETSLEASIEDSASRIDRWLAADQSTPSQRAVKNEQLCMLSKGP